MSEEEIPRSKLATSTNCPWCKFLKIYEDSLSDDLPPQVELLVPDYSQLTGDKLNFIEQQAEKRLSFAFEVRTILRKEAHETLKWLFGIILGSSGFIVSKLAADKVDQWWIVCPLMFSTVLATIAAVILLEKGMRAVSSPCMGNEPANLVCDDFLSKDGEWVRVSQLHAVQDCINQAKRYNAQLGKYINLSRRLISTLPLIALIISGMWWVVSK